jgi:hypothetical protein
MAFYRRAVITSPAIGKVTKFQFSEKNTEERRSSDADMTGDPGILKKEGSGSFVIKSGAQVKIGNSAMSVRVEDVAYADKVETITQRTLAFTKVMTQDSMDADNNGGESSRAVAFTFGDVTES